MKGNKKNQYNFWYSFHTLRMIFSLSSIYKKVIKFDTPCSKSIAASVTYIDFQFSSCRPPVETNLLGANPIGLKGEGGFFLYDILSFSYTCLSLLLSVTFSVALFLSFTSIFLFSFSSSVFHFCPSLYPIFLPFQIFPRLP